MKPVQRLIEPAIIYAGSTAAILSTIGEGIAEAQPMVAVSVGLATLVYTILKIIQIFRDLMNGKTGRTGAGAGHRSDERHESGSPYRRKRDRKPQGKNRPPQLTKGAQR